MWYHPRCPQGLPALALFPLWLMRCFGEEGPHLPHGLIPVAPQPLPDALHAELEGPEAALTDLPAVLRLMARRRHDEVMG